MGPRLDCIPITICLHEQAIIVPADMASCGTMALMLAFRRFLTGLQDAIIAISWDLRAFLGRPEFLREPMAHVNGT
jgi:hypothetical protein